MSLALYSALSGPWAGGLEDERLRALLLGLESSRENRRALERIGFQGFIAGDAAALAPRYIRNKVALDVDEQAAARLHGSKEGPR